MLDELKKYKQNGHFFFKANESLVMACNAPTNKSGIYVVYALEKGKINLIYVGRSGKLESDGSVCIRKAGLGGIKDRIVNGHQFGKNPRRISWPKQMTMEKIDGLDVYWYVTHNENYCDNPREVERSILEKHMQIYGRLPRWNNEI
jgi:hypothetical protein